jgi:D-alanyl-lipoteichoic acid acyltransferase DltB (MBOAT superfamily)
VATFYVVRRFAGRTAGLAVIVFVSAMFYTPFGPLPSSILALSLCLNLLIGAWLAEGNDSGTARRKALLALGLVLDFANLATFKYLNQVVALVAPADAPLLAVAIPAGISFYTFHQAVFLVHAYNRQPEVVTFLAGARGALGKLRAFVRYAAFVAFFPQLVIGPITFMSEFGPQIERSGFGRLRLRNIQVGLTLAVVGLFKKIVIADWLALHADPLFHDIAAQVHLSPQQAVLAIVAYYFQLYFDFSGYSDMALGIARLFGLRLPMNFDSPLRATGIIDFYRRWHMTLTRVIVLFIFTPLSLRGARFAYAKGYRGWRGRALAAWLPLLLNFEVIALWHAAKFTFVAFGLAHSLWYVAETELRTAKWFRALRRRTSDRLRTGFGLALTVVPLALTFALFRSQSLHGFAWLLGDLVTPFRLSRDNDGHVNGRAWLVIGAIGVIVYLLPNIYEMLRAYRPAIPTYENQPLTPRLLRLRWRPNLVWGAFVAALAAIAIAKLNVPSPFLYGGF